MATSGPLELRVQRYDYERRPDHHIAPAASSVGWSSYLPPWKPSSSGSRTPTTEGESISRSSSGSSLGKTGAKISATRTSRSWKRKDRASIVTGFRNPWPSWHKPSQMEIWKALEWGEDDDPCIQLARQHAKGSKPGVGNTAASNQQQADQLLKVIKPDFSFPDDTSVKTTWLGHAGMLIQLPPLKQGGRPLRCLFDPIFSMRCSPTQAAGPIRSYPAPCKIEDLPQIDVLVISHNHFDHLDYDSILALWKLQAETIHLVVPLGNRQWFIECGIDASRITELDWWDTVELTADDSSGALRITCTPAQHNTGRSGIDGNMSLWSSWYLEHPSVHQKPYRVFFAGDSGYQFHASPGWPPPPPLSESERGQVAAREDDDSSQAKHPVCPAFSEIASRLGTPHLLLLPVAVGATYDFLRSFAPVPDSVNPIPRHSAGVTAANHMPPWDAVRVLRTMTGDQNSLDSERPVAIAMHWGTFVTDPIEVLKTLGQLEWACEAHGVRYARTLMDRGKEASSVFVAVNHGESVVT